MILVLLRIRGRIQYGGGECHRVLVRYIIHLYCLAVQVYYISNQYPVTQCKMLSENLTKQKCDFLKPIIHSQIVYLSVYSFLPEEKIALKFSGNDSRSAIIA